MHLVKDPKITLSKKLLDYRKIRKSLSKDFRDLTIAIGGKINKAMGICENFKQKIDKGQFVMEEEFKQELEKIYENSSKKLMSYILKELESKVYKERSKIGDLICPLEEGQEKKLSIELYHKIEWIEQETNDIFLGKFFMQYRTKELELKLKINEVRSKINEVRDKISETDAKGKIKEEEIEKENKEKTKKEIEKENKEIEREIEEINKKKQQLEESNDEKATLNQISENKKSNFVQKFLSFFSWLFSWPSSFF